MKNNQDRSHVIKCPNCGANYLPAEIYLPDYFLGKPNTIEKDHIKGTIRNYFGIPMDTHETYRCDYCDAKFNVDAKIQFVAKLAESEFDKEHSTPLFNKTFIFNED